MAAGASGLGGMPILGVVVSRNKINWGEVIAKQHIQNPSSPSAIGVGGGVRIGKVESKIKKICEVPFNSRNLGGVLKGRFSRRFYNCIT